MGVVQKSKLNDEYAVPSQKTIESNSDDSKGPVTPNYNIEPYHNFMPVYKTLMSSISGGKESFSPMYGTCVKLAEKLGEKGDGILRDGFSKMKGYIHRAVQKGFSEMRAELMTESISSDQRITSNTTGMPNIGSGSRKRKATRKKQRLVVHRKNI